MLQITGVTVNFHVNLVQLIMEKKFSLQMIKAFNAFSPSTDLYIILHCMELLSDEHDAG